MADHFARALRNNATPEERKLWQALRILRAEGRHFRRQVRIGPYVADFACHGAKLVIELDGSQHGDAVAYDTERSAYLNAAGYDVLRFWNRDISEALEGVVDRIRHAVHLPADFTYAHLTQSQTPTPALPSRVREKEQRSP